MYIQLRDYQKQDFSTLITIVKETWHYEELCSPHIAILLARVFLSSCLTNYTFSKVAVLNGEVVGMILVKDIQNHRCPLSNRFLQIKSLLSLYSHKEGREVAKIFTNVSGIDKQLLKESNISYMAEIALFVIKDSCRGLGLGKTLFQSALQHMKQSHIKSFYLFTDTSCNYGFYEHQGMTRRIEKERTFFIKGQSQCMNFFIYDYQLF